MGVILLAGAWMTAGDQLIASIRPREPISELEAVIRAILEGLLFVNGIRIMFGWLLVVLAVLLIGMSMICFMYGLAHRQRERTSGLHGSAAGAGEDMHQ